MPLKAAGPAEVGFIVHLGDDKTAGGAMITVPEAQREIWLVNGGHAPLRSEKEATLQAIGSLANASAHWYASACPAVRALHGLAVLSRTPHHTS